MDEHGSRAPDWLAGFCAGSDHQYLSFGQRLQLIRRALDISLDELSAMLARGGCAVNEADLSAIEEDAAGCVDFVLVYMLAYVIHIDPASWLWVGLDCEYDPTNRCTLLHPRISLQRAS